MRDFIGLSQFVDQEYSRRIDHRFHAMGHAPSPKRLQPAEESREIKARMAGKQPWASQSDLAWIVCLHRCGAIDRERAATLIRAIRETWNEQKGVSGEERILEAVGGDMDIASTVNYGRTLQEPMFRLKMRDQLLGVFDDLLALLETIHRVALDNLDTLMVGHTHMNHAQPMTYAHFMVSAFDGIMRGVEQLELAYRYTNLNSGGCGSCSGTLWAVDRELMAELLGMDGVVEPTYDCEAAQDHSMAIMFGLSNVAIHLSRYAMNHYIWAFDEIDMIRTQPGMCGMSSFMPQKCDSGTWYERVRISAADVMGETVKSMMQLKSEPHGDVLQAMQLPNYTATVMADAHAAILMFKSMLESVLPQKDRMRRIVRAGYSCATELAYHLVKDHGYGGRLAHSIVATMVRMAREQGKKSYECTGRMLDRAAEYLDVRKPGLDTRTVQTWLDPEVFVESHRHLGGTAPEENARLLEKRRTILDEATRRQQQRRESVREGLQTLDAAADEIAT